VHSRNRSLAPRAGALTVVLRLTDGPDTVHVVRTSQASHRVLKTRGRSCSSKSASQWLGNLNCLAVCHMQVAVDRHTLLDGPKGTPLWPFVCTRTARSMTALSASPSRFPNHWGRWALARLRWLAARHIRGRSALPQ